MTDKIQSQMLVMRLQNGMPVKNGYRVRAILKGAVSRLSSSFS